MTRGRPREFDEEQALKAAMDVFWQKGYEGASCESLLSAMKLNAGSMYAAFEDKKTLYHRAFDLYCKTIFSHGTDILNGPGTPLQNVRSLIQYMGDYMASPDCKGCFVSNTLMEFGSENQEMAHMVRQVIEHFQNTLKKKLKAARKTGELSKKIDPADMAAFIINMAQGLNVMARAHVDKKTIRGITKTALTLLR